MNLRGLGMVQGQAQGVVAGHVHAGVSTQNYQLAPKYLTEKVVRKPRVITERVTQPVYQRVINRPSILRERHVSVPNLVQTATVVKNNNRTRAVQRSNASLSKTVNVPGNTVFVQPVVQPTLLVRNEKVQVRQSAPQTRRNPHQVLPSRNTQATEVRDVDVPAATVHNRTYLQPTLTREFVNVNVQRAPSRTVNHDAVTAPVVVRNQMRQQNVVVPGRTIYNQRTVQPQNTQERVRVNLIQSEPTSETREAIVKPTIRKRNVKTKYHNVVYRVPIQRTVQVVKPNYVRVNDVRTVFVPVDENGQELSAAAAGSVLGADGFAFNGNHTARYNMSRGNMSVMRGSADMDAEAALSHANWTDADLRNARLRGDLNGRAMEASMNMRGAMNWDSSDAQGDADAEENGSDLSSAMNGNWRSGAVLIGRQ